MLSPKESSFLAEKQWTELEALVGKVPKPPARGRVELKPKPDLRRPNEPAEPPSKLKDEDTPPSKAPRQAKAKSKPVKKETADEAEPPAEPASSSSSGQRDAGSAPLARCSFSE